MLEKCGVTGALRFAIPACRRMPYIGEELQNDPSQYTEVPMQEITEAVITGAEAVVDDRAYLRGQYFKLANEFFSDEDARHEWQHDMHKDGVLSTDSASTMNEHDFKEAITWIEAYMQDGSTGEDAPESTPVDEVGAEVDMESAEAVQSELDAELATKRERVIELVAETPMKTIQYAGFTTWWHQLIPEEADHTFDELGVLDLDILIAAIEAQIDKAADAAAEENGDLF